MALLHHRKKNERDPFCEGCGRCRHGGGETGSRTLDNLAAGASAVICQVGGEGALRRRLLDMGLTPGTTITVQKRAPLGDPIELFLRNYELTLRADEARLITVKGSLL